MLISLLIDLYNLKSCGFGETVSPVFITFERAYAVEPVSSRKG